MLEIRWRTVRQLIADGGEDIAVANWEESEVDHTDVPMAIDYAHLTSLEKAGNFKVAGLYVDGTLQGYASWTIMHSPLRKGTLHAFCDAIFVMPETRGHGLRLIRWSERELEALGVVKMFMSSRPHVRLGKRQTSGKLGDVFIRLGYEETETVYAKVLGAPNVQRKQSP